jgi:hypothetical protein
MIRSLTIAMASMLATAGVIYGARHLLPDDAPPSVGGSAKISPALATPAKPPPETVEIQMRRAEFLQGLAKYHRLMLDTPEGNEPKTGDRPAVAESPNENAPPPAPRPLHADRKPQPPAPAPPPPARHHWQDPGYTAR